MPPILIAGAGPVGLTLAAELARYGLPVRLIDRCPHPTETSKALVLWSRTLELLDRAGCTPAFLAAGLRAHGATLRRGGTVLGHPSFESIASTYNYALMIPQSATERLLADHLHGLGVAVEREVELTGFRDTGGGVEASLRHADGREETVATPWLIGCDGAHSAVRHGLGVTFAGAAQGDDWLLADVRLAGDGAPPGDEIATYLHRDGPLVIFPIPGGRARVIAVVGRSDPARPDPTLAEVQAVVDARAGGGIRVEDPVWLTHFRINERKVSEYRHGRVFLAGDAAHIHSPAGGQGMNTGMQDAINLAWKLAMVVRGQAAETLLDSYSPERNAVGEMVLRNAGRLTDMATLSNPAAQAARNLALRVLLGFHAVRDRMAATMSEIEIAYAGSPLSRGPHAGDRWPPEHDAGPPPGAGATPLFVLYADDAAQGAALAARFPALVEAAPRPAGEPGRLVLVRPDGYAGLVADAGDWETAGRYLAALAA
ncbi:FAD-dependent monooxygenase [uncultured Methylobacterium sp.]|jgi:2-polyprenyl-6-methoxyphenol hydroxylase-like FAD-dependent oxidoreductase|uniref:FAD-dependent monooxygenase n=1 Tax=uncultured Methylobacterium sp. TaxID=157278 RepID=UPI002619E795|nr:FAD-dependent monooxygenase [uncultured Methylobacterium sp.]